MPPVVRPYRGVSADDRRAQRRERLLEAGLDVLGEQGIAGVTMTAVRRRAGLTDRYFYESFRDRDDFLLALLAHSVQLVNTAVLRALEDAPDDTPSRVRAVLAAALTEMTDDPRQARAFREAAGDPAIRPHLNLALAAYAKAGAWELGGRRKRTKQDQARLELAATVLVGGLANAVTSWLEGGLKITRAELIDECTHLYVAAAESIDRRSRSRRE
ncbi:TetR/AcrR family transcriptional regulator [Svornostia abyssi]|uniref:TetR/AcrR family transcriptional regulator n=1 Tax=Svornostia abyssi TaxID=2898438 RepID=A0ABY5PFB4_9ACTN|nr:TetR/AcrR family transcriptional regulator [Parviterribacteraceae bacterium J379]